MSCDRCSDIHKAQLEGKQNKECPCTCHNNYTGTLTGGTFTGTGDMAWTTDYSDAGGGINLTTFNNTWAVDPTTGAQDATLNYGTCKCCGSYHG